jgi:hypothetical protein
MLRDRGQYTDNIPTPYILHSWLVVALEHKRLSTIPIQFTNVGNLVIRPKRRQLHIMIFGLPRWSGCIVPARSFLAILLGNEHK